MNDDNAYVRGWLHPQLAKWAEEDEAATKGAADEDAEYQAFADGISQLERERIRYFREHETLPASERRVHDDRVA